MHIELRKEEQKKAYIVVADEELVSEYYEYRQQLDQMAADFREVITHPNYSLPFLQPGRLVKIKYQDLDFGWGVIINYQKRRSPKVRMLPLYGLLELLITGVEPTHARCRGDPTT